LLKNSVPPRLPRRTGCPAFAGHGTEFAVALSLSPTSSLFRPTKKAGVTAGFLFC